MRLCFASSYDHRDRAAWSGSVHYMHRALSEVCPVVAAPRLRFPDGFSASPRLAYLDPKVLEAYAAQTASAVKESRATHVIATMTSPVAKLEVPVPVVFWHDAVFASHLGRYPEFTDLPKTVIEQGHAAERSALRRADLALYTSDWARDEAIAHYDADPSKLQVIRFGPNLESPEPDRVATMIASRLQRLESPRLLFVASDWIRKGGDRALDVMRALRRVRPDAELLLVGTAPGSSLPPGARYLGWLDKTALSSHYAAAHLLLVPSVADCAPVVIAEAHAHGLPTIACNVGGMTSMLEDWRSGVLLPPDADGGRWSDTVVKVLRSEGAYEGMCRAAHEFGTFHLNWRSAARRAVECLQQL